MLVATPYRDFDAPPRIISEIRKTYADLIPLHNFKPRLTGELLVKFSTDVQWWPQRVCLRNGQLFLDRPNETKTALWRLPLRYLSLQASNLPNSLSLCRGRTIIVTLQMPNQQQFDLWVRTIAVELIRQTPLDAVKYLDIFTLANCWQTKPINNNKDCNFNEFIPVMDNNNCTTCQIQQQSPSRTITNDDSGGGDCCNDTERTVENLLKKCQNAEIYVPVKEKLILFESLCRLGRKVRSSEDVSYRASTTNKSATKRAQSMHDLTNLTQQNCVRQICKYFEIKNNDDCGGGGSSNKSNSENLKKYSTVHRNQRIRNIR